MNIEKWMLYVSGWVDELIADCMKEGVLEVGMSGGIIILIAEWTFLKVSLTSEHFLKDLLAKWTFLKFCWLSEHFFKVLLAKWTFF